MESPKVINGAMTFMIPVLVVFEDEIPMEGMARFMHIMSRPQPLYHIMAKSIKKSFGPYQGATKAIVGYPVTPDNVPQAFAGLGIQYGGLNRPMGLETDDEEKTAVAVAAWTAANCDIAAVRELLLDHLNKQARGR